MDVNNFNTTSSHQQELLKKYDDIFHGIGKLNNHQVKIHIDESVQPITQCQGRIPFHIWKKLKVALEDLEQQDIIEKANGPTPWVSPIVKFPKPKNPKVCIQLQSKVVDNLHKITLLDITSFWLDCFA